jgi:hypothetical protein
MAEDDVPRINLEQQMVADTARWIREAESDIERLAAESGKAQKRTIGIQDNSERILLQVHLTCEPRQFAKKELASLWASIFKSLG